MRLSEHLPCGVTGTNPVRRLDLSGMRPDQHRIGKASLDTDTRGHAPFSLKNESATLCAMVVTHLDPQSSLDAAELPLAMPGRKTKAVPRPRLLFCCAAPSGTRMAATVCGGLAPSLLLNAPERGPCDTRVQGMDRAACGAPPLTHSLLTTSD
ncbi:hypothetical protein CB1_000284004 [Camelus ferus]|nr:hypothetical protein CB1_000284004 [Camelus ferus]